MSVQISRAPRGHLLQTTQRIERPLEEVFAFFADAGNLDRLTPPSLRFRILTPPPIVMRPGALIDYRLRIRGLPVRWRSEITAWEPPFRFVDEQRRGPYRWWRHEHRFTADGGATLVADLVEYGVPGGSLVNRLVVAGEVTAIFEFRRRALAEVFRGVPQPTRRRT